jgi:diphosphoinositol-polyphosphate diphosphatase
MPASGYSKMLNDVPADPVIPQSDVIPYRFNPRVGEIEVLLISNRSGSRYIFPKGNIERGLRAVQSAVKEAMEEAGVRGLLPHDADPIADYQFTKNCKGHKRVHQVHLYPLYATMVQSDWPERTLRDRTWMPITSAIQFLASDAALSNRMC